MADHWFLGFRGTCFELAASFAASVLSSCAKEIQDDLAPFLLVAIGFFIVLSTNGISFFPNRTDFPYLVLRCILGCIAIGATAEALRTLQVGDVAAILMSEPVYVNIFSFIFLGEKLHIIQVFVIVLNVMGVICVSKPSFIFGSKQSDKENSVYGAIMAAVAAFSQAAVTIILHKLKTTPVPVTVFWLAYTITSAGLITMLVDNSVNAQLTKKVYFTLSIGFVSLLVAQFCHTMAFKYEMPSIISMVATSKVVFSYIAQVLWFKATIDLIKIVGGILVVISILISGLQKYREDTLVYK